MGNFKSKLARFMYGRYGTDELSNWLFVVYFILLIANLFIRSNIISLLIYAVIFIVIFRTFSRNIYKRQRENEKFMKLWKPVKSKGTLTIQRIKDIKTKRYRRCPHCKSVLRLPRKTGKHKVDCPRCHNEFEVRVLL
ncbi:hypothetical protein [Acetivibrio mesophilus]|uniref:Zn-finger containing protein n=1 Tax=Acetivibrio mesophilus TaxID=2487273 RepID=A0A4Q0I5Z9_9FIRM|nr:hypothetical protein [Acetivibrio mesophilus]ODM27936.1 hypothetical protein A7W90_17945 [Clostridium sp. Bc-iso-3]RXE58372.1 hypothetical protein EFD62_12530 [Acetivibrio mesophilus]HHV28204.1 hypothetical protein [Clostridium sp.]